MKRIYIQRSRPSQTVGTLLQSANGQWSMVNDHHLLPLEITQYGDDNVEGIKGTVEVKSLVGV